MTADHIAIAALFVVALLDGFWLDGLHRRIEKLEREGSERR